MIYVVTDVVSSAMTRGHTYYLHKYNIGWIWGLLLAMRHDFSHVFQDANVCSSKNQILELYRFWPISQNLSHPGAMYFSGTSHFGRVSLLKVPSATCRAIDLSWYFPLAKSHFLILKEQQIHVHWDKSTAFVAHRIQFIGVVTEVPTWPENQWLTILRTKHLPCHVLGVWKIRMWFSGSMLRDCKSINICKKWDGWPGSITIGIEPNFKKYSNNSKTLEEKLRIQIPDEV